MASGQNCCWQTSRCEGKGRKRRIGRAKVVKADIACKNGVIHVMTPFCAKAEERKAFPAGIQTK